ncbi:hypothetical protein [Gemella cuniculi]|uniref:hypothetical protein n=1 Tax=Gemella cuniculi TaxID=150240 RepID=UPI0012EB4E1D|nr:hypothetical protein [Gemella cuniculi]
MQFDIVTGAVERININKVIEILELEQTQDNYSTLKIMLYTNIDLFWEFVDKFAV